jgi:hypothetical protein
LEFADLKVFAGIAAILLVSWLVVSYIKNLIKEVRDKKTAEQKFHALVDGAMIPVGVAMFGMAGYFLFGGTGNPVVNVLRLWIGIAFSGIVIMSLLGRAGFALYRNYKDIPSLAKKFVLGSGTKTRSDSEEKNSDAR